MASCSCNDKQKKVKKSQYSLSLWSVLWLEFERSGCQKQLGFMNFSVCILHLDEIYKKKNKQSEISETEGLRLSRVSSKDNSPESLGGGF